MKKVFSVFLTLIMVLSATSFTAYAKVKAPSKPTSVSASSTTSTITVKWKKQRVPQHIHFTVIIQAQRNTRLLPLRLKHHIK